MRYRDLHGGAPPLRRSADAPSPTGTLPSGAPVLRACPGPRPAILSLPSVTALRPDGAPGTPPTPDYWKAAVHATMRATTSRARDPGISAANRGRLRPGAPGVGTWGKGNVSRGPGGTARPGSRRARTPREAWDEAWDEAWNCGSPGRPTTPSAPTCLSPVRRAVVGEASTSAPSVAANRPPSHTIGGGRPPRAARPEVATDSARTGDIRLDPIGTSTYLERHARPPCARATPWEGKEDL